MGTTLTNFDRLLLPCTNLPRSTNFNDDKMDFAYNSQTTECQQQVADSNWILLLHNKHILLITLGICSLLQENGFSYTKHHLGEQRKHRRWTLNDANVRKKAFSSSAEVRRNWTSNDTNEALVYTAAAIYSLQTRPCTSWISIFENALKSYMRCLSVRLSPNIVTSVILHHVRFSSVQVWA